LTNLILFPRPLVLRKDPEIPISPTFDVTRPGSKTATPIGQIQRSILKGNSTGFKVDHLDGVGITHWSKEGEPGLIIDRDGEMGPKFLEGWMNLGFRQRGTMVFKDK
jgi:hypothetical protein